MPLNRWRVAPLLPLLPLLLLAASPAAASLRVLRIGFSPRDVPLPADRQQPVTIAMARLPALLASVHVSDRAVCGGSTDRGSALSLWEQARAGLLAAVVARETKPGRMNVLLFTTDQAPDSRLVRRQTLHLESGTTGRPFVAAARATDFAAHGYMQEDESGRTLHAPDADILLDESFAATHCFTVAEDADHPGRVGLAFRPARDRDGIVDVRGTLWIRRDVPALETLEFRFTGLEPAFENARAGGSLTFRTMPNGLVYIERWTMRLPEVEATNSFGPDMPSALSRIGAPMGRDRRELKVAGIRYVGGEVTADSSAPPLAGADVTLLPLGQRVARNYRLGTLVRARIPGALLVPYAGSLFLASERGSSATLRPLPHALPNQTNSPTGCWASIYLDGVRIYDVGQGKPAPDFNALNVDRYAGVEFYAGAATTPLQFGSSSGFDCGALVLWTRER